MMAWINVILVITALALYVGANYRVGTGIGDVTGPIVEINFLGYAKSSQKGSGLHLRQYARCYIIDDGYNRIAFLTIDSAMVGFALRIKVLEELKSIYGDTYNEQNLILSATHTHSTPGGYMQDVIYDISTAGFVKETFTALLTGIIMAIEMAHNSIQSAKIYYNSGILLNTNINRSPLAYLLNPESERKEYLYDVDKEMIQLKFVASQSNKLLGVINWFPIHPTSMNNTNTLVSTDNVGFASVKLEQYFNSDTMIGKGPFVASFAPTNLGDVSPNIKGPHCIDTGLPCIDVTSTCNGKSQKCIASGPGRNMFDSTQIIGTNLYHKALELIESENCQEISGTIKYGHQYINMPEEDANYTLQNKRAAMGRGCVPALGYSFAAGTTDGPGAFSFQQGTKNSNPFWDTVRRLVAPPAIGDIKCHSPKPILIATGRANFPYRWQPSIVSVQLAILGNLILAAVPSEFSTMSGRRLKKTLKTACLKNGDPPDVKVIIAGLCNSYSSYVTTYEEYQMQRYEGASTLYGPHTLAIYQSLFENLLTALMTNKDFDEGTAPKPVPDNYLLSFTLPVILDTALFNDFGDCLVQPPPTIPRGSKAIAKFVSSNPRTGDLRNYNLIEIQRLTQNKWKTVATDANWETIYEWKREGLANSEVTITWFVSFSTPPGQYRIGHYGYYKSIFGSINSFSGFSNQFSVF